MAAPDLTTDELNKLNSRKAIQFLLQDKGELSWTRALRHVSYESQLESLQVALVNMQSWTINHGKRLCVLFEGRDAAGKGGAIRRITHHLNPRYFRVIALPKPTEIEKGQWYFQRYIKHLPNPGEMVFFDRSWYNRAVVEPVNGFCTQEEYERFMREVNEFEAMLTNDGIQLVKFYFSITKDEQARRFRDIKTDPLKVWKISPVDEKAQQLWDLYTAYKERMFKETDTKLNPWIILQANKKPSARMKAIEYLLKNVPYNE